MRVKTHPPRTYFHISLDRAVGLCYCQDDSKSRVKEGCNVSRTEANEQYSRALKQGRKYHKDCILHGNYPYLQVLDEILDESMIAGRVDIGVVEIPIDQIVGTKTAGRRPAFAGNFMPLMSPDSEFAVKWKDLCAAHLGDEGIRDPIRCYEYLGRFYVQEGNKRVSVLRSYQALTIPAYVIRVIPIWSEDPEIQSYYDFMQSYALTGLYRVRFSRPGCFGKLQAALGYEPDHSWTEDERRRFTSGLFLFQQAFQKLGGESLPTTVVDALLVWLKVYPFDDLKTISAAELEKSLSAVWADVKVQSQSDPISVSTEPAGQEGGEGEALEEEPSSLLGRLFKPKLPSTLNVAFINERFPEESDWARAHDLGREYLETVMGGQVTVQVFNGLRTEAEADEAIGQAVERGAQVIFATTPPLIGACRKAAAQYPNLRILNCSAAMPYTGVRTYYSRIYEAKFISGAIAGAMSPDGRIGYVASNPIFGVPASINAFALGARLTNPRAKIELSWSCVEEDAMEALARRGVKLISNRDIPTPDRTREPWGLCQVREDGSFHSIASPYWHWGNVYVKLVRSIFRGGWDALSAQNGGKAVNYWWGMKSRVVDVLLDAETPAGVKRLVDILRQGLQDSTILPFQGPMLDQEGNLRHSESEWFSPEEILHMDWLCSGVEGSIPHYDQLLPMARSIVRFQGLTRDQIPPEKEGPIL